MAGQHDSGHKRSRKHVLKAQSRERSEPVELTEVSAISGSLQQMKPTLLDFSLEGQVPCGRRIMTGFGSDFHDCLPEPYVLRYSEASNTIWLELLGNTVSSHAMRASSMLATAGLT